jgi:hypothetical protein
MPAGEEDGGWCGCQQPQCHSPVYLPAPLWRLCGPLDPAAVHEGMLLPQLAMFVGMCEPGAATVAHELCGTEIGFIHRNV